MQKIVYKIIPQSSLILSPRSTVAFYGDAKGFEITASKIESKLLCLDKLRVIYPFYRYGEYLEYLPEKAEYYIPGSSIKGALWKKENVFQIMVDDIEVPRTGIALRNLYKGQYLGTDKKKFAVFFENVGVEMLKAGKELKGELYLKEKSSMEEIIKETNKQAKKKIKNMLEHIVNLKEEITNEELLKTLKEIQGNLQEIQAKNNIIFLGGYKGLLHSIDVKQESLKKIKSALFIDRETMLPHGIVKIMYER